MLTPRLIRIEYNESGIFEDKATQTVANRDFDSPPFSVSDTENDTKDLLFRYMSGGETIAKKPDYLYHADIDIGLKDAIEEIITANTLC